MTHQSPLKWDDLPFDPSPFIKDNAVVSPTYASSLGALYADDCMAILPWVKDEVVDTVFADPPFNLGKEYGNRSNDSLRKGIFGLVPSMGNTVCSHLATRRLLLPLQPSEVECVVRSLSHKSWNGVPSLDCG